MSDIETTLTRNRDLQPDRAETAWTFGQVLALLLLIMPLRDLVEMVLARQDRRHQTEKLRSLLLRQRFTSIDELRIVLLDGANPNLIIGGRLALVDSFGE